jgi:hypothetical protein
VNFHNSGGIVAAQHGYQALGKWHEISLLPLNATDSRGAPRAMGGRKAVADAGLSAVARPNADAQAIARMVKESPVLQSRVGDPSQLAVVQGSVPARRAAAGVRTDRRLPISTYGAMTLATETVIAEGLRQADLKAAKSFGAEVVEEGLDGKVLLRVNAVDQVFGSSICCWSARWDR